MVIIMPSVLLGSGGRFELTIGGLRIRSGVYHNLFFYVPRTPLYLNLPNIVHPATRNTSKNNRLD